jgi:hypothetical protein
MRSLTIRAIAFLIQMVLLTLALHVTGELVRSLLRRRRSKRAATLVLPLIRELTAGQR